MITFLRFGRAHTLVGTTLSLLALYLMAARHLAKYDWALFAFSLFSCLAANVYITGLNQVTDVAIDRINKPYLPLASGAYSMRTGKLIVAVCGVLAVATCLVYRPWLMATVLSSLAIGTAYSLEPIRLKRYHFWAAFCIIVVRGLIVNLLLYLHFQYAFGGGTGLPAVVWLLTAVIFGFSIIIAWFKDLPDTEGDEAHDIQTLTLLRGRKSVWRWGSYLLGGVFLVSAVVAYLAGFTFLAIAQLALLLLLLFFGSRLDLERQASIARYYQSVWLLFFLEYGAFALLG